MKRTILITMLALASILGFAQSTNPLNYSGRMYLEAIEIYSTPRYVSFEDHAILSQKMRIPSVEITKCDLDFEKGVITVGDQSLKVKVREIKEYEAALGGWVVVLYMDMLESADKMELVWFPVGNPYLQQITKSAEGVDIARMILSKKPYVASEEEALMNLLQGLGTM